MFDIMIQSGLYELAMMLFAVFFMFLLMRFVDKLTGVKFNETKREIYSKANVAVAVYRGCWLLAVALLLGLSG